MAISAFLFAAAVLAAPTNATGGNPSDYAVALDCYQKLAISDVYSRTLLAANGKKDMADKEPLNKPAIERFGIILRWEGKRAGMTAKQVQDDLSAFRQKANAEIPKLSAKDMMTRSNALQSEGSVCVNLL